MEEIKRNSGMEREYRNRAYQVAALDMDGTVLNDKKKMDEDTRRAIHEALAAGKEVVFCTGRSYAEMEETLREFPDMHYLCGESGALVYDLRAGRPIRMVSMEKNVISQLWKVTEGRVKTLALEPGRSVEKVNLYHTSPAEREKTWEMLRRMGIKTTMVYSEISSLECSALGLSKASGLGAICEVMGITMDQVIMVGDADNDLEALRASGLAVAMGNANENVKKICQVQVADNNHNGCAQAIQRYLLKREG